VVESLPYLHCPFCFAPEDERVEATNEDGDSVLLVMFDCPFYYQFSTGEIASDDKMQKLLDDWRTSNGEAWLESVGPIMKARELRNIERHTATLKN
jgi:hypothetical protein